MLKIIFMGTPDFSKDSLEALYEEGHEIVGVVTTPDKPKGRGMKVIYSQVKEYAMLKNMNIYQPEKIRNNQEFIDEMKKLNPDLICVVAYGKIIPKEILEIPKYGCINVHPSLLPKYRGAAPIQWAIINGDKKAGVTIMYLDEGMDSGDMILQEEVNIGDNETSGELWDRLSKIGAKLLIEAIKQIEKGTASREKQGEDYTLAPMIDKEMSKLDWESKTATEIKNLIRGLNPTMGTYTFLNSKKIKFWKVNVISKERLFDIFPELSEYAYRLNNIDSGTVLFSDTKKGLYIKANDGIIEVLEIQAENSKKMNIHEFLKGNHIDAGSIFE